MKSHFFKIAPWLFSLCLFVGNETLFAQNQGFEADFNPVDYPLEFLPGWYGNEVNSTSSRIFQVSGLGRNGSKALAVQPISTFNGKIWIGLNPADFLNPEVEFYAKSVQNGSGSRPVLVYYSWGNELDGEFSSPAQIGSDSEFSNTNQDFRKFSLGIPDGLKSAAEAVLVLEIRYGPGSGSAARWIMDDFEFGDLIKDEAPPKVIKVKGYSENSLLVQFSEKVDPVFSTFPLAFDLEGKNPEKAELRKDSLVVLTFSDGLEQNKSYPLSIQQIPDIEGNFLQDTTLSFTFSDPTDIPEKELVINELMPAPRPDQDLPNVEFIELFHVGENEFRLEGIRLSNSRTETVLEEIWLSPGKFLILAPENLASQLSAYGQVLPVKSWPTLLNSGDQIAIKSSKGVIIDQISFATSTWGGSEYASGGYSLEVPNPGFLCENTFLLKPSKDPQRGTPGSQNSIFQPNPEISLPRLESAYFEDSLHIFLSFSEPVLPNIGIENFSFSPNLDLESLNNLTGKELKISLKSPAEANLTYEILISGVADCLGNPLPDQRKSLVLPEFPENGDLIINELLFNPRTGDPKFVEIKNISQKYLRLENWALANANDAGVLDQVRPFGTPGLVLAPDGYLAITTDSNALRMAYPKSSLGNFLQISTLPSYPIGGGTVVLVSPEGEEAESFSFDEDLHHPLLRDPKGVSLERVSPQSPAFHRANWQSASGNEEFATPGRKNSQSISSEFEGEMIWIDPQVFDPEGSSGSTFVTINYQLDQTGWIGTFNIYSASGQMIQTLAQNQIMGSSGLMTWTGTDVNGKLVRAGYYVLVAELYEPNGKTILIKKTIVVATRL
ncbi:MAG TPA: lamin tail domain-containing protein [Algoriphagus sp.]|nr:lamin tail domain-containing protein [Algoriphagus sp.]